MITFIPDYVGKWQDNIKSRPYDKAIPQEVVQQIKGKKIAAVNFYACAEFYATVATYIGVAALANSSYNQWITTNEFPLLKPAAGIAALVTVHVLRTLRDGTINDIIQGIDAKIKIPSPQIDPGNDHAPHHNYD